jgi:capsular polysaccharide biosynthesis protein
VAGAFSFIYLEKPSSRATAQVILRPLVGPVHGVAPLDDANARYLQVMSALARSPSLVNRVVRAANVPGLTAARLLESSRVTPEADSDALDFTVTSASPATATPGKYLRERVRPVSKRADSQNDQ